LTVALAAAGFAAVGSFAATLAAVLCRTLVAFDDGPRSGRPRPAMLVFAAAAVGASLAIHHADGRTYALGALLIASVVACTYCDVARGLIPDYFTLAPLVAVIGVSLTAHDVQPVFAAMAIGAPFGLAALLSRGRGMGWGDVKFAALAGAVLGIERAICAFIAASLVAAGFALARRRRSEPIAFVPYLAGSAAAALALVPGAP